jgi:hypothetical protein
MAVGALSLACGGDDPESSAPLDPSLPNTDTSPDDSSDEDDAPPTDREWSLDFEISGRSEPMTARAELFVDEGVSEVRVAITGRTTETDVMIIELTFPSVEAVVGPHVEQVGLPEDGPHAASGSLDDIWYYSQSGQIEFSLSKEGSIAGSFDIALARGEETPGVPVVFQADEVPTPMVGSFEGSWVLTCHSRLMGHSTLIPGGDFCESLDLGK